MASNNRALAERHLHGYLLFLPLDEVSVEDLESMRAVIWEDDIDTKLIFIGKYEFGLKLERQRERIRLALSNADDNRKGTGS